jgi:hypothetical protein
VEQRKKTANKRGNREAAVAVEGMVIEKNLEEGKIEIGYIRSDGKVGSKFEMYNKLDALTTPS